MKRIEVQSIWEKIVDLGFSDYNKLNRAQRVWLNIEPLTTSGLLDHYINYGADKNSDTIADLEYLNFHSVANQLRAFNQKYFPNGVPLGPDARQKQFDKYPENQLEKDMDEINTQFWDICNQLENALHEHINQSIHLISVL
ncbi:DUF4375 domain-containing protein [Prolixibacteraceae bacterium JC049]|nr:DUF4375 domain-containing protein [Prolixibacteraceae bacterium JC049]